MQGLGVYAETGNQHKERMNITMGRIVMRGHAVHWQQSRVCQCTHQPTETACCRREAFASSSIQVKPDQVAVQRSGRLFSVTQCAQRQGFLSRLSAGHKGCLRGVIRSHVDFLSRALVMAKGGTPIIDLTSHSSDEEGGSSKKHKLVPESKGTACEPPSKRLRAGEASGGPSDSKPGLPKHVPFELIWVRQLGDVESNRGCLGQRLAHLVRGRMRTVVVMDYMIDLPWLLSSCPDLRQAERVLLLFGDDAARQEAAIQQLGLTNFEKHAPPLPISYGVMHSKAVIIEYEQGVRVIIHTSNLLYIDSNNKTQGIWFQDFPFAPGGGPAPSSPFQQDLLDYLGRKALPKTWAQRLQQLIGRADMSSARAHLVPSVPGYHNGANLRKYGHMRVRDLLSKEPLPSLEWLQGSSLVLQCSSLGSLTEQWLHSELATSFMAHAPFPGARPGGPLTDLLSDSLTTYTLQSPQEGRGKSKAGQTVKGLPVERLFFVWPTVDEVRDSLEGWPAGGSIPGSAKNVSVPFLRRLFSRYAGGPANRTSAAPHIKSYARFLGQRLSWVLLSSHNLSKAAWGELQKTGSQLMIRHYELGTLHTPSLEAAYLRHPHCGFTCTPPPAHSNPAADLKGLSQKLGAASSPPSVELFTLKQWQVDSSSGGGSAGAGGSNGGSSTGGSVGRLYAPLPYNLPPARYTSEDRPWMWDADYGGELDSHGLDQAAAAEARTPHYGRPE